MKKFLIGLVTGILLAGVAGVVTFFAVIKLGERRPAVADGSTLVLRLEGAVRERSPMEMPLPALEPRTAVTVHEIWETLNQAASDARIKAVVLMPKDLGAGWAKLEEIHDSLARFRRSGKPVVAWLRSPGAREYFLATAADRVLLAPEDVLDLKGLRAELMYFRNTLDKLGVVFEIEHMGRYKDAGDMFTRTAMSPETREVVNSVLDEVFGRLVGAIAGARKKTPEQVRALIDEGPFLATRAKASGLVDDLVYEDQVYEDLRARLAQREIKKVSHRTYYKAAAAASGRRIALVVGEGAILRGGADGIAEEGIFSENFIRVLRQVGNDAGIRGVIVRVDSGGGDALASDDILRELKLLSKKKPLVFSMSDAAASGGYYIAMTGDPVIAYPSTFTGSIGVLFGKANLRGLYDKLGIRKELVTRGRFADLDTDYAPLSEAGRKKLRESIGSIYDGFLARVAEGRNRKVEEVRPLAEGRVWLGSQAHPRGLVDELGGLDKAVERIREKARLGKDEKIRLVAYPGRRSLIEYLFGRTPDVSAEAQLSRIAGWIRPSEIRLLRQGGILRWNPWILEIR